MSRNLRLNYFEKVPLVMFNVVFVRIYLQIKDANFQIKNLNATTTNMIKTILLSPNLL